MSGVPRCWLIIISIKSISNVSITIKSSSLHIIPDAMFWNGNQRHHQIYYNIFVFSLLVSKFPCIWLHLSMKFTYQVYITFLSKPSVSVGKYFSNTCRLSWHLTRKLTAISNATPSPREINIGMEFKLEPVRNGDALLPDRWHTFIFPDRCTCLYSLIDAQVYAAPGKQPTIVYISVCTFTFDKMCIYRRFKQQERRNY